MLESSMNMLALEPQLSYAGTWHADEMMISIGGDWGWSRNVIDEEHTFN